ncbi:hypothetical protein BO83DRAFT_388779 [Aspergillus eucalypticola CBS 122712]|uniref:Uncharacterized protein n=1 Tax=Aspergillus eucalypticola (strain CBS 122712 / IBT 29274) TaxID=1448314 RepID=A0A317VGC2_ASPEC|nr:uncharacterized protein BO83DRAFT_388779 [Aspergillus eucalypticola CBS 122712]PWY73416.1 hypothetical protein BO83DRAFT_388779 [Aspergillus eucalypticola CBS 122712]
MAVPSKGAGVWVTNYKAPGIVSRNTIICQGDLGDNFYSSGKGTCDYYIPRLNSTSNYPPVSVSNTCVLIPETSSASSPFYTTHRAPQPSSQASSTASSWSWAGCPSAASLAEFAFAPGWEYCGRHGCGCRGVGSASVWLLRPVEDIKPITPGLVQSRHDYLSARLRHDTPFIYIIRLAGIDKSGESLLFAELPWQPSNRTKMISGSLRRHVLYQILNLFKLRVALKFVGVFERCRM